MTAPFFTVSEPVLGECRFPACRKEKNISYAEAEKHKENRNLGRLKACPGIMDMDERKKDGKEIENVEKEFSAWIGNLGKYVGGELQGEWVGVPASPQELEAALARIGGEEQIVFDYDLPEKYGFLREILGEYSSPEELNLLGAALHGLDERELDALAAFADFQGTMTVQELLNAAAQAEKIPYYGYDFEGMENVPNMGKEEKYGYTVVENYMPDLVPMLEGYHIKDYLDYEAIGRDAVLSGDVYLYEDGYIQAAEKGPDLSLYDMDGLREQFSPERQHIPDASMEKEGKETENTVKEKGPKL